MFGQRNTERENDQSIQVHLHGRGRPLQGRDKEVRLFQVRGGELSKKVKEFTDKGLLVPDEIVFDELMKMVKVKADVTSLLPRN